MKLETRFGIAPLKCAFLLIITFFFFFQNASCPLCSSIFEMFLQLQHNCCKSGTHIVVSAHVLQKNTTEAALSDMYMLQTAKGYMLWTICYGTVRNLRGKVKNKTNKQTKSNNIFSMLCMSELTKLLKKQTKKTTTKNLHMNSTQYSPLKKILYSYEIYTIVGRREKGVAKLIKYIYIK